MTISSVQDGQSEAPESSTPRFVIQDCSKHTMRESLLAYVQGKVHQDIRTRQWQRITVRGKYLRDPPARLFDGEKMGKQSNWHRPSATVSEDQIEVDCMPGADYTEHYAGLIATYLALMGRNPATVRWVRPPGDRCEQIFLASNLRAMGAADVVIIGYIYQLTAFVGEAWSGRDIGDGLFAWQKQTLPNGTVVAYLACMASFWGDIGSHLVRALQQLNHIKSLIYLGKAGSLRPEVEPNEWIVTGGRSFVGDELVTWDNVLAPDTSTSARVLNGEIVTVPSPLCESFDWLSVWQARCNWVDCEVGHMALACREGKTKFGYLHLISDNVARYCSENLANEFEKTIRQKRKSLFQDVENIIASFISRIGAEEIPNDII